MPLHDRLLISLAAFTLCGVALWLTAGLLVRLQGSAGRPATLVRAAAIALGGVAIWWPGHFAAAGGASASGVNALVPGVLADRKSVV